MSKPPRTDFKALIAGQVAPAANLEAEPEREVPALPAAAPPAPPAPREVVSLKPRRSQPVQKPVGEGTLKQRTHQLSVYLEVPVYEQLRDIAFHERTKLHPLILEGIDLVLKKRGAPSIKELTKTTG
jgi:hypothetical protein